MSLSVRTKRSRLWAIAADVDGGGGGALQLFGNTMPETPETAPGASPTVIVALEAPAFELHPTEISMTLVQAVGYAVQFGEIKWGRFVDGNGLPVYQALAGPPGSGKPIIVSDGQDPPTANVYIGGEVTVNGTFSGV